MGSSAAVLPDDDGRVPVVDFRGPGATRAVWRRRPKGRYGEPNHGGVDRGG